MTKDKLRQANLILSEIRYLQSQLEDINSALNYSGRTIGCYRCSDDNPFVVAALNYEKVTLRQQLRALEKELAEL